MKRQVVAVPVVVVLSLIGIFLVGAFAPASSPQPKTTVDPIALAIAESFTGPGAGCQVATSSQSPSVNTGTLCLAYELTAVAHHVEDRFANPARLAEYAGGAFCADQSAELGFVKVNSGLATTTACPTGYYYGVDPSITITNEGHDFIQGKIYGVTHAVTLVTTDYAVILGISTSATGILVTDSWAGTGPCSSGSIYNTGGSGAQPTAATTQTAGTPSAGSVTTTLAITFSITATISSAQAACITTEVAGGSHPGLFGEVPFGPDSFISGDSLTETDTMTSA